ncbi:hypothetical protein BH23PLA1_BH23PLA1_07680 [soil metagenome]
MAAKKTATKKKGASRSTTAKKVTPRATVKATASRKKGTATNGVAKPKAAKAPAASAPASASASASAKKAAPIKLNDRQFEFLRKIREAGVPGYRTGQKVELRTIDALVDRKLVKRGPKDKDSGHYHYQTSKAGEKFLDSYQAP